MLDPISAIGVAAATVQFFEFATKLLAVGKEVHRFTQGITEDLVQIDEVYSHLQIISARLARSIVSASSVSQEEQALFRLAKRCQEECTCFILAVEKSRTKSGSKRTFRSFTQALRLIWS